MNADPSPRTGPILLGLFILGQLFFLVASNLLDFLASLREDAKNDPPAEVISQAVDKLAPGWLNEEGHLHDAQRILTAILTPWAQLTGQTQNWSLFSPDISRDVCFPAVEFRWEDGAAAPEVLLSDNEPADPEHYFRFGQFRVRRFEGQLDVTFSPEASPEDRRAAIRKRVDAVGKAMRHYLLWRWREFERRHPGRPRPEQIILLMRCYQIRPPEEAPPFWDGPFVHPIARLRPPETTLEAYNPESELFEAP
jgi:hypothetical protein